MEKTQWCERGFMRDCRAVAALVPTSAIRRSDEAEAKEDNKLEIIYLINFSSVAPFQASISGDWRISVFASK